MPSSRILLLGPAPNRMPPEQSLDMLRPAQIPGISKCVLTKAKFNTNKLAKTFNIEANYAPEPVQLQTLAAWSGLGAGGSAEQLNDAIELFALRAVFERDGPFDYAILQRQPIDLTERWPALVDELGDKLYLDLGEEALFFNLTAPRGSDFIENLWALHLTGAVYAIEDYSPGAALAVAADSVCLGGNDSLRETGRDG